jgi:RNA polymerase sigma-70 factor (ECF subfamily)
MAADTDTIELIAQIRSGDDAAWNRLVERELPQLKRFAHGKLPVWARSANDTQDVVQSVLVRVVPRLAAWETDTPGAFRAFLRKAVANHVVDEIRRARRRVSSSEQLERIPDRSPSPLAQAIRREALAQLRDALAQLPESDRRMIAARFGGGHRYAEVAERTGRPTANAARVAVERAVERVVKVMQRARPGRSIH